MPPLLAPLVAPTGGILFNRKDSRGLDGEFKPILDREGKVIEDAHNYVFNKGKDFTSLPDRHRFKMRIPDTSIVNRVGDCKMCFCFGWKLTGAQLIYILNLFAFCVHTTMVFVTAWAAWWKKDMSQYDSDPYHLTIYRLTARWDNTTVQGYTYSIESNGIGFNVAIATLCFFAISAVFHLYALIVGLFESSFLWFFKQIDDVRPRARTLLCRPRVPCRRPHSVVLVVCAGVLLLALGRV